MYGHISYIITQVRNLCVFMYVYTYLYIFMHEKFLPNWRLTRYPPFSRYKHHSTFSLNLVRNKDDICVIK